MDSTALEYLPQFLDGEAWRVIGEHECTFLKENLYQMLERAVPDHRRPSEFRFPGVMPHSLSKKEFNRLDMKHFYLTPKTKGVCEYLMLLQYQNQNCFFFFNRRMEIFLFSFDIPLQLHERTPELQGYEDPFVLFQGTVVAGDVVRHKETREWLFVPHDILCTKGKNRFFHNTKFEDRLKILRLFEEARIMRPHSKSPFLLWTKWIVPAEVYPYQLLNGVEVDFEIDGHVLIENGGDQRIFKIKEAHEHTQDALVRLDAQSDPIEDTPFTSKGVLSLLMANSSIVEDTLSNLPLNIQHKLASGIFFQLYLFDDSDQPIRPGFSLSSHTSYHPTRKELVSVPGTWSLISQLGQCIQKDSQLLEATFKGCTSWFLGGDETQPFESALESASVIDWRRLQILCTKMHENIVEWYWHQNKPWFCGLRIDKSNPNAWSVVQQTLLDMEETITSDDLRSACSL